MATACHIVWRTALLTSSLIASVVARRSSLPWFDAAVAAFRDAGVVGAVCGGCAMHDLARPSG